MTKWEIRKPSLTKHLRKLPKERGRPRRRPKKYPGASQKSIEGKITLMPRLERDTQSYEKKLNQGKIKGCFSTSVVYQ
jgi:hypothetical protein